MIERVMVVLLVATGALLLHTLARGATKEWRRLGGTLWWYHKVSRRARTGFRRQLRCVALDQATVCMYVANLIPLDQATREKGRVMDFEGYTVDRILRRRAEFKKPSTNAAFRLTSSVLTGTASIWSCSVACWCVWFNLSRG